MLGTEVSSMMSRRGWSGQWHPGTVAQRVWREIAAACRLGSLAARFRAGRAVTDNDASIGVLRAALAGLEVVGGW
jgi:hypothetical protein